MIRGIAVELNGCLDQPTATGVELQIRSKMAQENSFTMILYSGLQYVWKYAIEA